MSSLPNGLFFGPYVFDQSLTPDIDRFSLFQKGPDALFIIVPAKSGDDE